VAAATCLAATALGLASRWRRHLLPQRGSHGDALHRYPQGGQAAALGRTLASVLLAENPERRSHAGGRRQYDRNLGLGWAGSGR